MTTVAITMSDIVAGVCYIVITGSPNEEFQTGDHITKDADGAILNHEAKGWMTGADLAEAARGVTVCIDTEWLAR